MEWVETYWYLFGLLAVVLIGWPVYHRYKNRPDPKKKKFVLVGTAGCLGCMMVVSVIAGFIAAIISLVSAARKLF